MRASTKPGRHLITAAALVVLTGQLGTVFAVQLEAQTEPQFRAYWVDSFGPGLYTEAEIDQLVRDTKAANMNAIVAQVTRRADCLCNRSIMTRTEAEINPLPFDPLQTLIEKAHAAGLEVHAWLNSTIMWAGDIPPRDPAHVFHQHGPFSSGGDNWVNVRHDGANRGGNLYFFDPGHPDAAAYIVSMFLSIVRSYDVDGINFDYIRYPDYNPGLNVPAWGYNPVAVARFQAATGRGDVPDPLDPQWMEWRREQVTGIVRRVYIESSAIKPHLRVSADTITYGNAPEDDAGWTQTRPYQEVLQDWRGWMAEGIIDLNIPMNYRREVPPAPGQRPMYDVWSDFIKDHQYNRHAAVGTALYLNSVESSVEQIRKALSPSPAGRLAQGWVGFSYRVPDSLVNDRRRGSDEGRLELARVLTIASVGDFLLGDYTLTRGPVFAAPVPIPVMPWKLQAATGHLQGVVRTPEGAIVDQARVDLYDASTGALIASRRTNGSGWFGFVDLSPGEYRINVDAVLRIATASENITVVAGQAPSVSLILSR